MPHTFTTPTYIVAITGADLTGCTIVLTLRQGRTSLNVEEFGSVDVTSEQATVEFTLTQVQSARFSEDAPIEVQANVMDTNGYRVASDIATIELKRQILREVRHA